MANSKLKNRKLVSHSKISKDLDSNSISRIANPAGSFNPTGGVFSARKFG